ncbi:MAG: patatin-like phospholipase family protein [Muribaculaceae bacterium]|nr:patatin-like phospholipase family protein [Muribaculaceae bacterium]
MMRKFLSIILSVCSIALCHAERQQSVGLVLSGGGAKGIAHIGFIQALEENDIPIDYITGTSMGAIVGSLYAIGYSPAQMMELIESPAFADWSSGKIPPKEQFDFVKPSASSKWVDINAAHPKPSLTSLLPSRVINPLPMDYAFMELYTGANSACNNDFNRLMVPFRCVASDIYRHKPVVFSNGELALAVRSSMSYPIIFQAIEKGDTLLVDGGLYDVFPVNIMEKDFNPDRIIGVDVSSSNSKPQTDNLLSQIESMMMYPQNTTVPADKGVNVDIDLEQFGLLSWDSAQEIYNAGYKRGMEFADSLKQRITSRRTPQKVQQMRAEFRKKMVPVVFDSVSVTKATPSQAELITQLFGSRTGHAMDLAEARTGFYRVASTGRMQNLVPHAAWHPETQTYSLSLKADVTRDLNASIGGYLSTSSASLIYAGLKWEPFGLYKPTIAFEGWAGNSYIAAVVRLSLLTARKGSNPMAINRFSLEAKAEADRTFSSEKMFYDFNSPAFLRVSDVGVRLLWERPTSPHSLFGLCAGYLHNTHRFHSSFPNLPELNGQNYLIRNLGFVKAAWSYSTLDNDILPTSGASYRISASLEGGSQRLKTWYNDHNTLPDKYIRGNFAWQSATYLKFKRFSLGILSNAWYTTAKLPERYSVAIADARQFSVTTGAIDLFDPTFRANGWIAAGLSPVVPIGTMLQVRLTGWAYLPMRQIVEDSFGNALYGEWFKTVKFAGELSLDMPLPIGAIRLWGNYRTSDNARWSVGLAIGVLIKAPKWQY